MTSKTSLSKELIQKGLFSGNIKRFWWLSALYTIALLLVLPFNHLLLGTSAENEWAWEGLKRSLELSTGYSEFQIILIYTVPVFLAVLLFNYLHFNRSTSAVHSLPVTRKQMFFTHCGTGILLLAIPVIITGVALMCVQQFTLLNDVYSKGNIFSWMGYTLLFDILFFAVAVFVGMFTGNPAAHIIFTYILFALPFGVYELVSYNLSQLLFGYSSFRLHEGIIAGFPPYALLSGYFDRETFTAAYAAGTVVLILATFVLALYAYRKRKLEAATDVVAFSIIRPIFKYGVTVCTMLLTGAYFYNISDGSLAILVFGYFSGSLLGYSIAEILLHKSFKIWRQAYKGYLIFALLVVVALFSVQVDIFGYVDHIPQAEEIAEVYFGPNIYGWMDYQKKNAVENLQNPYDQPEGILVFKQPENIKNISLLHREILKQRREDGYSQFIIYTLKNGKNIIRQYQVNERAFAHFLKPIYESAEYKEGRFPVLRQHPNSIKVIEIGDYRTSKDSIIISDKQEIAQLIGALRKDISNASFEEMIIDKSGPMIDIMNIDRDRRCDYSLRDTYSSTIHWLKQKGYYEKCILQPGEVKSASLEPIQNRSGDIPQRIEIKDPDLIQELLKKSGRYRGYSIDEELQVNFYTSSGSFGDRIAKDAPVSPELKEYFEKLAKN